MNTNRSNAAALIGGALLIAFGLLSLAGRIFRGWDWGLFWPFIIVGIGALFFVAMFSGGKSTAGFAVPGAIIGGIGLVLAFQNFTQHWEMMSYFWTLIIFFVGLGVYIMGWYGENAEQRKSGSGVMKVGVILFIVFGAFFESIFSSFSNMIFPILLILLGLYLVISRSGLFGHRNEDATNTHPPLNP